jgi:hypothetical protein
MKPDITLGGSEPAAWEKLDEALRKAGEASYAGRYADTMQHLRHGIEAATEFGVHRADGRWALVAERIERARTLLTGVTAAEFRAAATAIAVMFEEMHATVAMMRVARTRH